MTSGQRTALSLLISVILFAAFAVIAFAGLFSVLETRFYQPTILSSLKTKLSDTSIAFDEYTSAHMQRFSAFLQSASVKACVNPNQDAQDIEERTQLAGVLLSETSGLQGIRLIDSGGRRIHYSTFSRDIMRMQTTSISFNNYIESGELPLEQIVSPDGAEPRIILDPEYNRIIYSYPFYDSLDLYRGTLLFYINASDFYRYTVIKGITQLSDSAKLVILENGFSGFVMGLPLSGSEVLLDKINTEYTKALQDVTKLLSAEGGDWMLLTNSNSKNASFANVFREDILLFSDTLKILLLICVFVTLFLSILLIFNVKHDDTVIIKDRIKRFQFALLNEYLEKKQEVDWQQVSKDIQRRKLDAIKDVKRSLGRRAKRHEELVDSLLEKSWDEIFASITKQSQTTTQQLSINTQEIRQMLEEILATSKNMVIPDARVNKADLSVQKVISKEPVEVEELTDADEVADELEPVEVEELTDADEVADELEPVEVEELTDADEVADELEPVEVEELTDVDEVADELEPVEVEELTDADEVVDEVEPVEVEELTDADEVAESEKTTSKVFDFSDFDKAVEQENLEEEQPIENTSIVNEEDVRIFNEELKFGDVPMQNEGAIETEQIDFDVYMPDFSELDEDEVNTAKDQLTKVYNSVEETENEAEEDYTELESADVVDLIDDSAPFSFAMKFAPIQKATEIKKAETIASSSDEIIQESDDGLFVIPDVVKTDNVEIDKDFQNLVDSIL